MTPATAHEVILRHQSEASFMSQVIECAEWNGWWWWHDEDSRRNLPGLTDLILVRERVLWIETKKVGGRLRPEQVRVRDLLRDAGQEWHLWTPLDWLEIEQVLARKEVMR